MQAEALTQRAWRILVYPLSTLAFELPWSERGLLGLR
jgi:hypothetical protein